MAGELVTLDDFMRRAIDLTRAGCELLTLTPREWNNLRKLPDVQAWLYRGWAGYKFQGLAIDVRLPPPVRSRG